MTRLKRSLGINNHKHINVQGITTCVSWLSFNSLSPSTFMSVIHSTETVSWLLDVVARFRLESVFSYYAFRNRLSTLGQLFLIIFFHWGCLPHRTYITPHHWTWTYTHSHLSPLTSPPPSQAAVVPSSFYAGSGP